MLHQFSTLTWITSNGGPLLLLPRVCIAHWEGANPPSENRIINAAFRWQGGSSSPATDYDRACDVENYLGLIDVGDTKGLVLNDEPMMTAWWPTSGNGVESGVIVRWMYAPDEANVVQSLLQVPDDIWEATDLTFSVGAEPLYLFDAALSGNEVNEHLTIEVSRGNYSIATVTYQPNRKTALVLHRFNLIDE